MPAWWWRAWRTLGAPFMRLSTTVICGISLLHLYQGGMMLASPHAIGATPLLALRMVIHLFGLRHSHEWLGVGLIISALVAIAAAFGRVGRARIWALTPQHLVLGIEAAGGIWATAIGRYLDGTVIPWQHISTDQAPTAILFLVHTAAVIWRCRKAD